MSRRMILTTTRTASNNTPGMFPVFYDVDTGSDSASIPPEYASPAQGACFSLLTLAIPNRTITVIPDIDPSLSPSPGSDKGVIAGAIVGSVLGVTILGGAVLSLVIGHRKRQQMMKRLKNDFTVVTPFNLTNAPVPTQQTQTDGGKQRVERRLFNALMPSQGTNANRQGNHSIFNPNGSDGPEVSQSQWREAIEGLRREIEVLRQDRYESPPSYTGT
jgi:hypothetical protein